jgi:hypothetical protein
MPLIESRRYLPEGDGATSPDILDNRPDIRSPAFGSGCPHNGTGQRPLPGDQVNLAAVASQLLAPGFGGGEGILGSPGNHLPLVLGHGREDMDGDSKTIHSSEGMISTLPSAYLRQIGRYFLSYTTCAPLASVHQP